MNRPMKVCLYEILIIYKNSKRVRFRVEDYSHPRAEAPKTAASDPFKELTSR